MCNIGIRWNNYSTMGEEGREEGRWDIVSRDNNSTMIEQGRNANHVYAFMNLQ